MVGGSPHAKCFSRFLDPLGEPQGWLIVFDQRPDVLWDDKISWTTETAAAKTIHIVGC